ncbi:unnamed protein product [Ranitomeya imitator]|uniref:Protein kinase domain-containing protein n=1 Tax=Ranitomeya imitator TaxID=111125 RepID=A0ABN9M921_9NEOB|nr:unnamed protein product [Ranitomeya imitator]
MEVVKSIFTVAKAIYDQCEQAETNKKRCSRLKSRIELLLVPVEKLKNDPEKSKELERTLSELLLNLQNAKCWVAKYSPSRWWYKFLRARGIQDKFMHISEQLSEMTSVSDRVDARIQQLQQMLQAELVRPWDIKEIRATDLRCRDLQEIPGKKTTDSHSLYLGGYHKSPVMIKVLKGELNRNDDYVRETFQSECKTMKKYESPNILRLYGICIDNSAHCVVSPGPGRDPQYSLVMEYCEKGTLRELLRREPGLSWECRVQMSLDAARALYRLHQTEVKAILHGSLSSSRLWVDRTYCVKLSGFEFSKTESSMRRNPVESPAKKQRTGVCGPRDLAGHQHLQQAERDLQFRSSDLRDCGWWIPFTPEFSAENHEDIHQKLCTRVDADLHTSCPPALRDVIRRSLAMDPGSRPSAGEIADLLIALLDQMEA